MAVADGMAMQKVTGRMDRHAEWFNVCDRIEVTLRTHDVDGLSQRAAGLAAFTDSIV